MDRVKFVEDTVNMLNAQGCFAISGSSCVYKTEDGKKCAFGLHIPDALYDPRMEGRRAVAVLCDYPDVKAALEAKYGFLSDDMTFANKVQRRLHDEPARNNYRLLTLAQAKCSLFETI